MTMQHLESALQRPKEPPKTGWWQSALLSGSVVLGGVVAGWAGITSELNDHARQLRRVEADVSSQQRQLDRLETKLDQVVDQVVKK